MRIPEWLYGLSTLLYPNLCLSCQRELAQGTSGGICISCVATLPETRNWEQAENVMSDRLAGRLPLVSAAALFSYRVGGPVQEMIHHLKYYRRPDIGRELGRKLGTKLSKSTWLDDLHGIVPVPIHDRRRLERGYNQAEEIAAGVAEVLELPVFPNALIRSDFKGSQTRRGQLGRMQNVASAFSPGSGNFRGRHLLLVDDVMTTGATLDYCGNLLIEGHEEVKISIATLALAEK